MDKTTKPNKDVKQCSINIDGMSNTSKLLLDKYVDEEQIDILYVQETRSVCKEKLNLTNMRVVTDINKANNRGAAIYARTHISLTEITEIPALSKNIDSAWALIVVNNKRYIIGSVYVKLNYNNAISDVLKMLHEAERISKKYKTLGVIVAGDYNARHESWGDRVNNRYGNKLFESLDNMHYTVHSANMPTYRKENGYSVIDLYITSTRLADKIGPVYTDEEVHLNNGAPLKGHLPLLCNIMQPRLQQEASIPEEKLDIESINWEQWKDDIEEAISRNQFPQKNDPRQIWNFLEEVINSTSKTHGKTKKTTRHSKPYWTDKLTIALDKMKAARKRYNKRNTDPNKAAYIEAKEEFDMERKTACEDFILKMTQTLNTAESVAFWKKFNKLFKKKTDQGVDPLKDDNGGIITKNSEIEDKLFSTFFESNHLVSENFDNLFYQEVNRLYDEVKESNFKENSSNKHISDLQKILNSEVTIKEIKDAIKKTKCNNKSMDNHRMHPKMLHNLGPKALVLLQDLFNSCLETGDWIWKEAEVIFLKKDGKTSYSIPGSYRPISITSYIGKTFEKILAARIIIFLENQGILDPDQEGFTARRNTHRYLNRLISEIKTDLKDHTVIALFIDLEKAFDSVWKKGLISKLFKLNLQGKILALIDNFLTTRNVKLNVNGDLGETRQCNEYGLPQGSALSPVLFKVFLLDFFDTLNTRKDISCFKFADDGSVKIKNKSTKQCTATLKMVAECLYSWTKKWRININCQPNKTEFICFGTADGKANDVPQLVHLGNNQIKKVQETKVLGLTVDENLSFLTHSKNVLVKIQGKWAQICNYTNIHWGFNQKVITRIAQTYFLTSLHYAGTVWMTDKNMKEIEKLWYKIIKSAIGATFNLRKSLAEVILGLPPLAIQNEINKIKFYLKLNIKPGKEDRVRHFIHQCYVDPSQNLHSELKSSIKEVFKFLTWKLTNHPNDFNDYDKNTIVLKLHENFINLSTKSCSYTKCMIQKYTEMIWEKRITNEYSLDGFHHAPKPSCDRIPIPNNATRKNEVLLMSLFYPNNLFNSNVYRHTYVIESPLCAKCRKVEETPYHIIMECSEKSGEAYNILLTEINENEINEDTITLLKASRNQKFLKLCLEILSEHNYRDQINL